VDVTHLGKEKAAHRLYEVVRFLILWGYKEKNLNVEGALRLNHNPNSRDHR
jgi:hypothetical protein